MTRRAVRVVGQVLVARRAARVALLVPVVRLALAAQRVPVVQPGR
jgi:hypothetical protein